MSAFSQQQTVRPSAAPGTPYHLLARNTAHTWWRPLVALLVAVLFAFVALIAAMTLLVLFTLFPLGFEQTHAAILLADPAVIDKVLQDDFVLLVVSFGALVALLPPVLLTTKWVQQRPMGELAGVEGRLRWPWLGECLLRAALVLAVAFGVAGLISWITGTPTGPGFPGWWAYARVAILALLLVPFQSAAKEFVFRGFLLQTFTAWFRTPWPAIVLTSVLFLGGHGYTDPLVWCELLVMAGAMCWLTVRTGGLEAAIGLHVANNSLSLLVGGLSGVPGIEQAGDFAVGDVVPFILAVLGYSWWTDRKAAGRALRTVTGGRAPIGPWSLRAPRPESISTPG